MIIERIERAMVQRRVVRVTFFKELPGRPLFRDALDAVFGRRRMLAPLPVTRTVEVIGWQVSADGHPYADVIAYDSPGEEYPALRRIRLDRIAVSPRRGVRLTLTRRRCCVIGTGLDPSRLVQS